MAASAVIAYKQSNCTGCRLCMLACAWSMSNTHRLSDSAIVITVEEKTFSRQMTLDKERCRGCLACVAICPGEALVEQEEKKG